MTVWLIEPRDPVIFRDGKPFNASPGARAKTLSFPFPATTAGAVRTRSGQDSSGRFASGRITELLSQWIRGPILVELDLDNNISDWLFPAPVDGLLLKHEPHEKDKAHLVPLAVVVPPVGARTNLPASLMLVAPVEQAKQKPYPGTPAFWRWESYKAWLTAPKVQDVEFTDFAHNGPTKESRMHVSIVSGTQTAQDGALFQTSGLEFTSLVMDGDTYPRLNQTRRLALVLDTDTTPRQGWDFLGGERRPIRWRLGPENLPGCPPAVRASIVQHKCCRLILATPACFSNGFLPEVAKFSYYGVTVTIEAVATSRYQVVSGWDYRLGKPKPSRRLAPAGSVYFLRLAGAHAAIGQFVDDLWLQSISDDEQDRRDGFGLALLGAWDGAPKPLVFQSEETS